MEKLLEWIEKEGYVLYKDGKCTTSLIYNEAIEQALKLIS